MAATTGGLSREVIKWLQSLGLTTQIKNPRRDLSSGFAVAEIFNCYYPQDVEMFSYENATSIQRKLGNWEMLDKFFRKREVPITRELIDDTVHGKPDAAIRLLETAYAFLTNKTPTRKTAPPAASDKAASQEPAFAKPTASKLVRETLPDVKEGPKAGNILAMANKAQAIVEEHAKNTRADRDKRGAPIDSLVASAAQQTQQLLQQQRRSNPPKTGPRAVTAPTDIGKVQFREVQIKPCDVDPVVLRARARGATPRSSSATPRSRPTTSPSKPNAIGAVVGAAGACTSMSAVLGSFASGSGGIARVLSSSIEGTLLASEFGPVKAFFGRQDVTPLSAFASALPWLPSSFVVAALRDVQNTVPFLADALLGVDGDSFLQLLAFVFACVEVRPQSQSVSVDSAAVLTMAGRAVAEKDPSAALELLVRNGIAIAAPMLEASPRAMSPVIAGLFRGFWVKDPSAALAALRDSVPVPQFSACLREITRQSRVDPRGQSEAAAVWAECTRAIAGAGDNPDAIAVPLCIAAMADVASVVVSPASESIKVSASAIDASERCGWWEARTGAISLACELAASGSCSTDTAVSLVTTAADSVMKTPATAILALSAVFMSRCIGRRKDAAACGSLARVLLALPAAAVRGLLSGTSSVAEVAPESSGMTTFGDGDFSARVALTELWGGMQDQVAVAVASQATSQGGDVPNSTLEILCQCARLSGEEGNMRLRPESVQIWTEVFAMVKDAVYVDLCKQGACAVALELLEVFFNSAPKQALETMSMLLATVTVLSSDGGELSCRAALRRFIGRMSSLSEAHHTAVANLLLNIPPGLPFSEEFSTALSSVNETP